MGVNFDEMHDQHVPNALIKWIASGVDGLISMIDLLQFSPFSALFQNSNKEFKLQ